MKTDSYSWFFQLFFLSFVEWFVLCMTKQFFIFKHWITLSFCFKCIFRFLFLFIFSSPLSLFHTHTNTTCKWFVLLLCCFLLIHICPIVLGWNESLHLEEENWMELVRFKDSLSFFLNLLAAKQCYCVSHDFFNYFGCQLLLYFVSTFQIMVSFCNWLTVVRLIGVLLKLMPYHFQS